MILHEMLLFLRVVSLAARWFFCHDLRFMLTPCRQFTEIVESESTGSHLSFSLFQSINRSPVDGKKGRSVCLSFRERFLNSSLTTTLYGFLFCDLPSAFRQKPFLQKGETTYVPL